MSLSNYPPGVYDYMIDPPPCRCDDDCRCECPHGEAVAAYEDNVENPRGVAADGCVIVCRCSEMCNCQPEDFEEAE